MPIHTYRPKVRSVQAVQVSAETAETAARWCGGRTVDEVDPFDDTKKQVGINVPTLNGVVRASEGDYLVRDADGAFLIMGQSEFEEQYERPTRG